MKPKVTVHLRRKANGEVIGEVINEKGEIIASKHFGTMTEGECTNALKHVEREFPDACAGPVIEVSGD